MSYDHMKRRSNSSMPRCREILAEAEAVDREEDEPSARTAGATNGTCRARPTRDAHREDA